MSAPTTPAGSEAGLRTPKPTLPEIVRVVIAAVLMIAMNVVPMLVLVIPPVAAAARDRSNVALAGTLQLGSMALVLLSALVLLWIVARRVDRVRLRDYGIGWDRRSLPDLLIGMGVSLVIVVGAYAALTALSLTRESPGDMTSQPLWQILLGVFFLAFVLQGIPEEFIWRGYLLTTLQTKGLVRAVWISATVFGVMHLISQGGQENLLERFLYLLWPFGFAVAAGALRLTTGSLWAAVGIHAGSHVAGATAQGLGLSTGGPASWIVMGVLYTAVGVWALSRYRRHGTPDPQLAHAPA